MEGGIEHWAIENLKASIPNEMHSQYLNGNNVLFANETNVLEQPETDESQELEWVLQLTDGFKRSILCSFDVSSHYQHLSLYQKNRGRSVALDSKSDPFFLKVINPKSGLYILANLIKCASEQRSGLIKYVEYVRKNIDLVPLLEELNRFALSQKIAYKSARKHMWFLLDLAQQLKLVKRSGTWKFKRLQDLPEMELELLNRRLTSLWYTTKANPSLLNAPMINLDSRSFSGGLESASTPFAISNDKNDSSENCKVLNAPLLNVQGHVPDSIFQKFNMPLTDSTSGISWQVLKTHQSKSQSSKVQHYSLKDALAKFSEKRRDNSTRNLSTLSILEAACKLYGKGPKWSNPNKAEFDACNKHTRLVYVKPIKSAKNGDLAFQYLMQYASVHQKLNGGSRQEHACKFGIITIEKGPEITRSYRVNPNPWKQDKFAPAWDALARAIGRAPWILDAPVQPTQAATDQGGPQNPEPPERVEPSQAATDQGGPQNPKPPKRVEPSQAATDQGGPQNPKPPKRVEPSQAATDQHRPQPPKPPKRVDRDAPGPTLVSGPKGGQVKLTQLFQHVYAKINKVRPLPHLDFGPKPSRHRVPETHAPIFTGKRRRVVVDDDKEPAEMPPDYCRVHPIKVPNPTSAADPHDVEIQKQEATIEKRTEGARAHRRARLERMRQVFKSMFDYEAEESNDENLSDPEDIKRSLLLLKERLENAEDEESDEETDEEIKDFIQEVHVINDEDEQLARERFQADMQAMDESELQKLMQLKERSELTLTRHEQRLKLLMQLKKSRAPGVENLRLSDFESSDESDNDKTHAPTRGPKVTREQVQQLLGFKNATTTREMSRTEQLEQFVNYKLQNCPNTQKTHARVSTDSQPLESRRNLVQHAPDFNLFADIDLAGPNSLASTSGKGDSGQTLPTGLCASPLKQTLVL
ncbi:hypothetical protein BdWA1_000416 [Babesia duncani]|uniref:Uncharacterized protein n=1 Tax=Babesia duncani TaxID=323732 RepID=A0AAD9PM55_9APIC|nr:hypothetical protein BdWA1_000416 [Babesia duncani]